MKPITFVLRYCMNRREKRLGRQGEDRNREGWEVLVLSPFLVIFLPLEFWL